MQSHIASTHPTDVVFRNGEAALKCNHCDKLFRLESNLEQHIEAKHKRDESFPCEQCGEVFVQKLNLLKHRLSVHQQLQIGSLIKSNVNCTRSSKELDSNERSKPSQGNENKNSFGLVSLLKGGFDFVNNNPNFEQKRERFALA